MAKNTYTVTELTDDIDGGKADRTVTFAFDGATYEIDLSAKNAKAFDKALAPWVGSARKVRSSRGRTAGTTGNRGKARKDLGAIREWANANNYEVSDRGRIAQEIQDAYDAAH